jgi:hypothetical protein
LINVSLIAHLGRSFGVILWEMFASDIPFSSMSDVQAAMNVSSGMRPRIPAHTPPKTKKLIEACWKDNPAVRFTMTPTKHFKTLQNTSKHTTIDQDTKHFKHQQNIMTHKRKAR